MQNTLNDLLYLSNIVLLTVSILLNLLKDLLSYKGAEKVCLHKANGRFLVFTILLFKLQYIHIHVLYLSKLVGKCVVYLNVSLFP